MTNISPQLKYYAGKAGILDRGRRHVLGLGVCYFATITGDHNMTREPECLAPLKRAGISADDAIALRRIAMQLHRWHELECGTDYGAVERDETTGKVNWYEARTGRRSPTRDMETPALKRLAKIMARYPTLQSYVQGDPRGAALYILRPGDVPKGEDVGAYYSRGLAVYK